MTEPVSMSLNHKGTKLLAHGTLDTELKLLSSGHLVTITATFTNLGRPYSVQVQSVINEFTAGQK